jgi:hypothetical protein
MTEHGRLAGIAIMAVLLGTVVFAQTIEQLNPDAADSAATDQLGATDQRGVEDLQQIDPAHNGDVNVEQSTGRDLCDPQTSAAARRAAGIDCRSNIEANGKQQPRAGVANDPLLTPRDKTVKDDFKSLGLGDDVPATVILQQ